MAAAVTRSKQKHPSSTTDTNTTKIRQTHCQNQSHIGRIRLQMEDMSTEGIRYGSCRAFSSTSLARWCKSA
eukprot:5294562-Ditylum_brightwellii.AAC.1